MTDPRQLAADAVTTYNRDVDQVRRDGNLTAQGKQQRIAALTAQRDRKLGALRGQLEQQRAQTAKDLERRLFNVSRDNRLEYEQYAQMVQNLKSPKELAEAMERADRRGNTVMLQALAERAYDAGASALTEIYYDQQGIGDSFREWHQLQTPPDNQDRREQMNERALFKPGKPAELAGLSTVDIETLADASGGDQAGAA